jgi:hypothetical protein
MIRFFVIGLIVVFAVVIGMSQWRFDEAEDASATVQAPETEKVEQEEERKEEKAEPEIEMDIDVNERIAEWIASSKAVIDDGLLDPRIEQTSYDEGFRYYLEAEAIEELRRNNQAYLTDEEAETKVGKAMEQDLSNLAAMCTMVGHFQFERTSEVRQDDEEVEVIEHHEKWRDIPAGMHIAYAQIEMIIHDLEVAIHHNGIGDTYGVTYTLEGENVNDLRYTGVGG